MDTMTDVYLRLHNFIYNKCGFTFKKLSEPKFRMIMRGEPNPFSADKIGRVCSGVSITNIKGAKAMVIKSKSVNSKGYVVLSDVIRGKVRGYITAKTCLPIFHIVIKEDGVEKERIVIPQNPWKRHMNGDYSRPAINMQAGNEVSWVWDPKAAGPLSKPFLAKIVNGNITYL